MQQYAIDKKRILYLFPTVQELISYTVEHFVTEATKALRTKNRFCIALSGGSTPKAYLEALSQSEVAKQLDWGKIYIFWSDERAVLPTQPESNYKMAMQFFTEAPFSNAHFFRMEAENEDREKAALTYETAIKTYCQDDSFDIIYLGIGDDGHTASLFPHTTALDETKRDVVSTYVAAKDAWRMTFTFPLINRAKQIVVLVTGNGKAAILKEILSINNPKIYPAEYLGTEKSPALFFCDQKAAELCVS